LVEVESFLPDREVRLKRFGKGLEDVGLKWALLSDGPEIKTKF
jgi:hypothetical protein